MSQVLIELNVKRVNSCEFITHRFVSLDDDTVNKISGRDESDTSNGGDGHPKPHIVNNTAVVGFQVEENFTRRVLKAVTIQGGGDR